MDKSTPKAEIWKGQSWSHSLILSPLPCTHSEFHSRVRGPNPSMAFEHIRTRPLKPQGIGMSLKQCTICRRASACPHFQETIPGKRQQFASLPTYTTNQYLNMELTRPCAHLCCKSGQIGHLRAQWALGQAVPLFLLCSPQPPGGRHEIPTKNTEVCNTTAAPSCGTVTWI